jgi:hypothetical protein
VSQTDKKLLLARPLVLDAARVSTRGPYRNWRDATSTSVFSLLTTIMILGGMIYFQDASKHPLKCALLLGIGRLLTVVSWFSRLFQFRFLTRWILSWMPHIKVLAPRELRKRERERMRQGLARCG